MSYHCILNSPMSQPQFSGFRNPYLAPVTGPYFEVFTIAGSELWPRPVQFHCLPLQIIGHGPESAFNSGYHNSWSSVRMPVCVGVYVGWW